MRAKTKTCSTCGIEKQLAEFHRWRGGRYPRCRSCRSVFDYYARRDDTADVVAELGDATALLTRHVGDHWPRVIATARKETILAQ